MKKIFWCQCLQVLIKAFRTIIRQCSLFLLEHSQCTWFIELMFPESLTRLCTVTVPSGTFLLWTIVGSVDPVMTSIDLMEINWHTIATTANLSAELKCFTQAPNLDFLNSKPMQFNGRSRFKQPCLFTTQEENSFSLSTSISSRFCRQNEQWHSISGWVCGEDQRAVVRRERQSKAEGKWH